MASMDEVFRKFGEAAECAQLLEIELGTLVLTDEGQREGWFAKPDPPSAQQALDVINKSTLGWLVRRAEKGGVKIDGMRESLERALEERNRLSHSFFREHNFRKFSAEGCDIMLADLEEMHKTIFTAYKMLLKISGTDLDDIQPIEFPTKHVRI